MVPIFEEQLTRLQANYTLEAWSNLDSMEKSLMVAVRRIDIAMKNLQSEAEIKASKRK